MRAQAIGKLVQLRELILCKRLGREEIQRAGGWLVDHRTEHRHVVAEGLPRRCGGHNDNVASSQRVGDCLSLVHVEPRYAPCLQHRTQRVVDRGRELAVDSFLGWYHPLRGHNTSVTHPTRSRLDACTEMRHGSPKRLIPTRQWFEIQHGAPSLDAPASTEMVTGEEISIK